MQGKPNAVRQVPSRLLADSQIEGDFAARDTVFAGHNQPHGGEPLIEPQRGIFHDGADLQGKLWFRMIAVALVEFGGFQIGDLLRIAVRAAHLRIRPAQFGYKLAATVEV